MKPKHPLIIVLTVIFSLFLGGTALLELLRTEVVILDGAKEVKVVTFSKNIKQVLEEQSLSLRPMDEIYPPEETRLSEGLCIVIKRFKPITVLVGEREIAVYQRNLTTKQVLQRVGVMLGDKDTVSVSLDRVIKSGETILVEQEMKNMVTVNREVPFKNTIINKKDLNPGEKRIEQYGEMGVLKDYYEITRMGGIEVGRVLVKTEVLRQPIEQIMLVGPAYVKPNLTQTATSQGGSQGNGGKLTAAKTGSSPQSSSTQMMTTRSKNFSYKNSYVMIATAYDLSYASTGKLPGMDGYGITKSGTKAKVGTVAVDPTVIPLGTKLYIEYADGSGTYGYATAEDTGSAIKGYRVDLFFNTYQECIEFGRRRVVVYVLE